MPGNYTITTGAAGSILTANIYNADHNNHILHATPVGLDAYRPTRATLPADATPAQGAAADLTDFQVTVDPGMAGAESLPTSFREAILRYANYLEYLEQMEKDPRGAPRNFGGSIPENVMALNDLKDRAYKLSNELAGAYDRTSVTGQTLAGHWRDDVINRFDHAMLVSGGQATISGLPAGTNYWLMGGKGALSSNNFTTTGKVLATATTS